MIKDKLGQVVLEEDDIIDIIMTDPERKFKQALVKDIDLSQVEELVDSVHDFIKYVPIDADVGTFDQVCQSQWNMPKEYQELDIAKTVLDSCNNDDELQRCGKELLLFQERKLLNLLRFLKYFVDTMRTNNVVIGLGRGSSVSSFVLYKLGIHKVNSMFYDLDVEEFLR